MTGRISTYINLVKMKVIPPARSKHIFSKYKSSSGHHSSFLEETKRSLLKFERVRGVTLLSLRSMVGVEIGISGMN